MTAPSTGFTFSEQIYRLNSVFDPDFTGGGHQPLYYDQVSPLYTNYLVHAVKVDVTFTNPGVDGMMGAVSCGFDSLGTATLSTLMERPMTKVYYINNTGSQFARYRDYLPCHKVLGMTKQQYADDVNNTGAPISTNPSTVAFFRVGVASDTTSQPVINVIIRLVFYVQFWNRDAPTQS